MKVNNLILVVVIVGLFIALYFLFSNNKIYNNTIEEIKQEQKENKYKIDSLMYLNDKLLEIQDSLRLERKNDSILIEKKQKGINKLYYLLKKQNEEIDNSSSTDDYEYLLNITE